MAEVDTFVRIASFAYQIAGNKAVEWKSQIQAIELDKTYPGTIYIYTYIQHLLNWKKMLDLELEEEHPPRTIDPKDIYSPWVSNSGH